ncbi:MAG: putative toxin-antitoxin system toxin component, PIN family [Snowella sp.]|nr:putative toxin-antitoxin system toxin component, PIN family [Snowella sp.]
MKVIFDTNILISAAFRGGRPEIAIFHVINSSSLKWLASEEIIKEYKEVLSRPKLKLPEITKQKWLKLIDLAVTCVDVNLKIDFPRDRKDAKFLACAIFSNADYLITGDKDFNDAPALDNTRIITVTQFLEIVMN